MKNILTDFFDNMDFDIVNSGLVFVVVLLFNIGMMHFCKKIVEYDDIKVTEESYQTIITDVYERDNWIFDSYYVITETKIFNVSFEDYLLYKNRINESVEIVKRCFYGSINYCLEDIKKGASD